MHELCRMSVSAVAYLTRIRIYGFILFFSTIPPPFLCASSFGNIGIHTFVAHTLLSCCCCCLQVHSTPLHSFACNRIIFVTNPESPFWLPSLSASVTNSTPIVKLITRDVCGKSDSPHSQCSAATLVETCVQQLCHNSQCINFTATTFIIVVVNKIKDPSRRRV